jgi:hypothetical protein
MSFNDSGMRMPVYIKTPVSGISELTYSWSSPPSECLWLHDIYLDSIIPIQNDGSYAFYQSDTMKGIRFYIIQSSTAQAGVLQHATCSDSADGAIQISAPGINAVYTLLDKFGNTILEDSISRIASNLKSGPYFLTTSFAYCTPVISRIDIFEPLPVVAAIGKMDTSTYAGSIIQFANVSKNASQFIWNFADGESSSETHPMHVYNTSGLYLVQLKAAENHCTDTATIQINIGPGPTAVNQPQENPAILNVRAEGRKVKVQFEGEIQMHLNLELIGSDGKRIYSSEWYPNRADILEIPVPASGYYTLFAASGNMRMRHKIAVF